MKDGVEINLRNVQFIYPQALLLLVAIVQSCLQKDIQIKIVFPIAQETIGFLKRWRFHEAIESLSGVTLSELCDDQVDLGFLQNDSQNYKYAPSFVKFEDNSKALLSNNFIDTSFEKIGSSEQFPDGKSSQIVVRKQYNYFNSPHIKNILQKKFPSLNQSDVIVTLVELINNAYEHPGASTVCIMSYSPDEEADEYLDLNVYDNGVCIPETLRISLQKSINVVEQVKMKDIYVTLDLSSTLLDIDGLTSDDVSNIEDIIGFDERLLLVSSVFPGVSARAASSSDSNHERFLELQGYLGGDGNGLFYAAYASCHHGQGSLRIHSGNLILEIYPDVEKTNVEKKIVGFVGKFFQLDSPFLSINGNLVTARLRNGEHDGR